MPNLNLKKIIFILSVYVFASSCTYENPINISGLYIGLEEICWTDSSGGKTCWTDSEHLNYKWYYRSKLKIKGDSAFLDQSPISVSFGDTLTGVSDPGFYYYKGTYSIKDSLLNINLTETYCDYCGELSEINPDGSKTRIFRTKQYEGKMTPNGIIIQNYLYKQSAGDERLKSEYRTY
jgi:hypothetical protein